MSPVAQRRLVFADKNPTMRHNLFFGHSLRGQRYTLSGEEQPVNTCQKHTGIAHELATIFTQPGANALVIGSGSGSDVIGCLRAQLNVVAIDKDPSQFRGCKTRLMDYKANAEGEHKIEAKEVTQVQHLKNVARQFAAWEPDVVEVVEEEAIQQSTPAVPEAEAPTHEELSKVAKCIGCNQEADTADSVSCFGFPVVSNTCTQPVPMCVMRLTVTRPSAAPDT